MLALLGLIGVTVSATLVAYLCERRSDEERELQERLQQRHASYVEATLHQQVAVAEQAQRAILELVAERRAQLSRVASEVGRVVGQVQRRLTGSQLTPHRRSALDTVVRNLGERAAVAQAHVHYLTWLRSQISGPLRGVGQLELPCLDLPDDFPVVGQVIEFDRQQAVRGAVTLEYGRLVLADADAASELGQRARIVALVQGWNGHARAWTASLRRGALFVEALSSPGVAFDATVERVERNVTLLDYRGLTLLLERRHQADCHTSLVRGQRVAVYPVRWRTDLDAVRCYGHACVAEVSERFEDSLTEKLFEEVPLLVPDDERDEFDRRVGPVEESDHPWLVQALPGQPAAEATHFVFQNGPASFVAGVRPLQAHGALELEPGSYGEEQIDTGAAYAQFAVPLFALTTSEYEASEERDALRAGCAHLMVFLRNELAHQERLLASQEGVVHFQRWRHVVDRLIRHKARRDQGVPVEVRGVHPGEVRGHTLVLTDSDDVLGYMDDAWTAAQQAEERPPSFWLYRGRRRIGEVTPYRGAPGRLHLRPVVRDFGRLQGSNDLVVHTAAFPYPEIQQRRALDALRQGEAVNPALLEALLCPEAALRDPEPGVRARGVRAPLSTSVRQRALLDAALAERNLFLLQGPPGAGKTTFIVELIRQTLKKLPHARVLVVSQANVAVDEVLDRLAETLGPERLLRLGQRPSDRIEGLGISQTARHAEYLQALDEAPVPARVATLREHWRGLVDGDLSPDVAEALVARHQIVGATCVGLSSRRLGLERASFDLVVVDEAARATPGELLIPLLRAHKAVLIGDHRQLPPTIDRSLQDETCPLQIRPADVRAMYAESLFERLFTRVPAELRGTLDTQYRMPPAIGEVVGRLFYQPEGLACGKPAQAPLAFASPVTWIDPGAMPGYRSLPEGTSTINLGETRLVKQLLAVLHHLRRDLGRSGRVDVAVIGAYSAQKRLLARAAADLEAIYGDAPALCVRVDTIDAFQGNQADVVIYCATRTSGRIDFLNDVHRLNVALSRTKRELVIVGARSFLTAAPVRAERQLFAELERELRAGDCRFFAAEDGSEAEIAHALHAPLARRLLQRRHLAGRFQDDDACSFSLGEPGALGPRRIAAIDIGTTGVRYRMLDVRLLADAASPRKFFPPGSGAGARIGLQEARDGAGVIRLHRLNALVSELRRYGARARRQGVERLLVFGTAGLREAANRDDACRYLGDRAGVWIKPLPAADEANWTALGAVVGSGPLDPRDRLIVLDQGGGSAELCEASRDGDTVHLHWRASLPLGTKALFERVLATNPGASPAEAARHARHLVAVTLADLPGLTPGDGSGALRITAAAKALRHLLGEGPLMLQHGRLLTAEKIAQRAADASASCRWGTLQGLTDALQSCDPSVADAADTARHLLFGTPVLLELMRRCGATTVRFNGMGLAFGVLFAAAYGVLGHAAAAAA